MLGEFLTTHREELLSRARHRVAGRSAPLPTELELIHGLPVFFDQLRTTLHRAASAHGSDHSELTKTASHHGHDLFRKGLTVAQVVHDYGDLCQIITGLAIEKNVAIPSAEFQALNLCLDDAIASAVTEFGRQREEALTKAGTERLGVLAHEMRNYLNTAMLALASIRKGIVAPGGSTGTILERSLTGLQTLVDRSFADVRLEAGLHSSELVSVREVIEEVEIGAAMHAEAIGLILVVQTIEAGVVVEADRQILTAAITNLLQNAFKFTRAGTTVVLRARCDGARVIVDVKDECGGLPLEKKDDLLRPFVQRGQDRTGLGLGLSICVKAMQSMRGELRVRDVPGQGCVFTIDLPRHAAHAELGN